MANKLFLFSATIAFFFLLTNASIYRTIIEFDEQIPGPKEKLCKEDFQESHDLLGCQDWLHESAKQHPYFGPQERPELLQKCCTELDKETQVCVCPILEQVARAVKIQGDYAPLQTIRIYQVAKYLPRACGIKNVGVCPFKIPYLSLY